MGKFLAELVEKARAEGELATYFATAIKSGDSKGQELTLARWRWVFRSFFLRHNPTLREYLFADLFDHTVARQLTRSDVFVGFSGRTYRSFRRARKLGFDKLVLESATSHVDHVKRQHEIAVSNYPIEGSWLGGAQYRKTLREYEAADTIVVTSEYSRQSFLQQGIPASKLERRWQSVAPRFAVSPNPVPSDGFNVVYVGRLEVTKGIPVLLEAFSRLPYDDAELVLVGGFATDAIEQFLREKIAADPRIKIRPGDPLPYLHQADVLAHPSYEDGLGLGPLEALACGVPVIVTEDTGMKEFVMPGANGTILPTGDVDALESQLRFLRDHPLKGAFEPFSLATVHRAHAVSKASD